MKIKSSIYQDVLNVKLLVLGDKTSDKTNFINSLHDDNVFLKPTIGVDFCKKKLRVNDKLVNLEIWDCAGSERYRKITESYFKNAQGIFIVFNLSERDTFTNIQQWIDIYQKFKSEDTQLMLIGVNNDRQKSLVDAHEVNTLAKLLDCDYLLVNTDTGENVHDAFINLVQQILKTATQKQDESADEKKNACLVM